MFVLFRILNIIKVSEVKEVPAQSGHTYKEFEYTLNMGWDILKVYERQL